MRVRLALPSKVVQPDVLNAILEATTLANAKLLQNGEAPTVREAIRDGLRWKPEDFADGEHFDLAPVAAARGWGDCDDLAPWLAAEMRLRGDPGAAAVVRRSGPKRWHVVVRDGAGVIHDPSKWAGMKGKAGAGPAVHGTMAPTGAGALALLPYRGGWAARMDLPWGAQHVSGMYVSGDIEEAAYGAARGAALVGEECGMDLDGLDDLLSGLCGEAEEDDVAGFLDTVANLATTLAPAAAVIPGVGPLAAAALPMAGSLLRSLGGGGGGGPAPGPAVPTVPLPALEQAAAAAAGGAPRPMGGGGGRGMQALPLPGGGHVAFTPNSSNQPGPIIVRF